MAPAAIYLNNHLFNHRISDIGWCGAPAGEKENPLPITQIEVEGEVEGEG